MKEFFADNLAQSWCYAIGCHNDALIVESVTGKCSRWLSIIPIHRPQKKPWCTMS
jgi:hypothetical protein